MGCLLVHDSLGPSLWFACWCGYEFEFIFRILFAEDRLWSWSKWLCCSRNVAFWRSVKESINRDVRGATRYADENRSIRETAGTKDQVTCSLSITFQHT